MADNTVFRPVRGKDEKIQAAQYQEGYVYFATDTKKIYLDANGVRSPMGGNSGIYYGSKNFGDSVDEGQTQFTFEHLDLEINNSSDKISLPNIDDLILNIPDGCFYRVIEIEGSGTDAVITTEKLTIAGSGGGGGGAGTLVGQYTLTAITPKTITILSGSSYSIGFYAKATDSNNDITPNGSYELYVNGLLESKGTAVQGDNYIDVTDYLSPNADTTIRVKVFMDVGSSDLVSKSMTYTITTTEMKLSWEEEITDIHYNNEDFNIKFSISGANITKTVTLDIDGLWSITLLDAKETTQTQTYTIPGSKVLAEYNLTHGAHEFTMNGYADLNGTRIDAVSVKKSVIFVEPGNTNPIVSLNLFEDKLNQYETVFIPVVIYSEENIAGNARVVLEENSQEVDVWENVENCVEMTWAYTPTVAGSRVLTATCGLSYAQKVVEVIKLDIDNEEVPNYAFKFRANDFASNSAIKNWNSNGVTASFSDQFDWINGGLKYDSSNQRSYVCIKAGSTMTIDYSLFQKDARTNGKVFKIIFRASMCRDYDASVLSCVKETTSSWYGFKMNAQGSIFKSSGIARLESQYCEDHYIELEFDISKQDKNNVKNYVTMWMDGIPCGYETYTQNEIFTNPGDSKIVIGSTECDVHVCLIKVYEKGLTMDEHLQNFIADAPNATEMLARYKRNDILNEKTGEIDPVKTALANPTLLVHEYEIDRMTTAKSDKVTGCKYWQYQNSEQPILTASDVTIKVQGTSSQKYVIAAANLDSEFNQGFYDGNGTSIGGWSMSTNASPLTFFCTKVNVASCENANNAMNQEWYNLFQPYKCVLRAKNPKARDTMEFTNGVIFLKDKNKTYTVNSDSTSDDNKKNNVFGDTDGYISQPWFKFYSIGQMGNSKKNTSVFHDTSNALECCVEVCDNQLPQQHMVSDDYNKNDCGQADKIFEFRYPEYDTSSGKTILATHRDGWNNFVEWMAKSNPQPKYEEVILNDEDEFNALKYNAETGTKVRDIYIVDGDTPENSTSYEVIENYNGAISNYYILTSNIYGYDNLPLKEAETYEPYTFKGFIAQDQVNEAGKPWQEAAGYTPYIKGYTESTYAGTYTHDTYERRMAKMLSECEDHLVMDSVLYHFLMIETHCMIDNVAKNTFWASEDCQHWFLNKDYDNDTADGNDNEGKLTKTYGLETTDDGVFNANKSVWLKFVEGIKGAQDHMYTTLEGVSVEYNGKKITPFSKDDYLWVFEEWQNRIPERCYIEDYYRKYFRTWEVYGTNMYKEMLMGGKKQYQRAAFETYQEIYMSSRHGGNVFKNAYITLRLNGAGLLGEHIPAKTYCDCYASLEVGQQARPQRVKRNEDIYFEVPVAELGDGTASMHPANVITAIGNATKGFDKLVPKTIDLTSANKLRELYMSDATGKENEHLTAISFKACPMLEIVRVGGLINYGAALELDKCANLKEVNALNSTFTSVSIADNAPLVKLELQNPTALQLSNLYNLETLNIVDKSELEILRLNNIDNDKISSKEIVEKAIEGCKQSGKTLKYRLQNVKWTIDDPVEINHPSIEILETLKNDCQVWQSATEDIENPLSVGLTGDLDITANAYNNSNSIEIYDKYTNAKTYPNLDIEFAGDQAKLYTVQIYSGSGELLWQRKIEQGGNVDDKFLSGGPNGAITIDNIYKANTAAFTYEFLKQWKVYTSLDRTSEWPNLLNSEMPAATAVNSDLVFVPQFSETDRYYTLKFFSTIDESGNLDIINPTTTKEWKYGTAWSVVQPTEIPYKPTPNTWDLKKAYDFAGYSLIKDSETIVSSGYKVQNDQNFYACFKVIEDISKIVHEEWFDFVENTYNRDTYWQSSSIIEDESDRVPSPMVPDTEGYAIKIKEGIVLKGKITIPAYYNNKPVVQISNNFISDVTTSGITHVFMQTGSGIENKLYQIGSDAFGRKGDTNTSLKYFDFSSVRYIGSNAFLSCPNMEGANFKLGKNTFCIEKDAFKGSIYIAQQEIHLPSELRYVSGGAFANLNIKDRGNSLYLGTETEPCKIVLSYPGLSADSYQKFTQNNVRVSSILYAGFEDVYFYSNVYKSETNPIAEGSEVQVDSCFKRSNSRDIVYHFNI